MFHYTPVGKDLIGKLCDLMRDRESVVLLGPRQGGKRYVMNEVAATLQAEGRRVTTAWDLARADPGDPAELKRLLWEAAKTDEDGEAPEGSDPFVVFDWLHDKHGGPVWLFASNIDGLSPPLAREFLQSLRARVAAGKIVAMISGEQDLRDLVHGPGSDFNVATYFVLQGLDEDAFRVAFDSYVKASGIQCPDPARVSRAFWKHTDGSAFFLRLLLFHYVEACRRGVEQGMAGLTEDHVDGPKFEPESSLADMSVHLRHAQRRVSGDPDCWPLLRALLGDQDARVPAPDNAPRTLEFAGLAVRENGVLRVRSALIRKAAKVYWNERRFADLHALHGNWEEAFRQYAGLKPSQWVRPVDVDDRVEVDRLIGSLGSRLQSETHLGAEHLRHRFSQGCALLLGLDTVFFERKLPGGWALATTDGATAATELAGMLPTSDSIRGGIAPVHDPWTLIAVAAVLEGVHEGAGGAVAAGNLRSRVPLSRERIRLAERLVDLYQKAHHQAVGEEAVGARLTARDQHLRTINEILALLGGSALGIDQVMEAAANGLRKLGYYRVLLCMVNPTKRLIEGVVDRSDDPAVDTAVMTKWSLDSPEADIQPYVIRTREPKVVPNPGVEPLINQKVHLKAGLRPLAIVPILDPNGDAIGTIHVERGDSLVPATTEVDDLLSFGRQFAVLIQLSEHVRLGQNALDLIPDPVCLVNLDATLIHANSEARKLFFGELPSATSSKLDTALGPELGTLLSSTLETGTHNALHQLGFGVNPDYRGTIHFDVLKNWRGDPAGALIHIHEANYLERAFELLNWVAQATDTESAIQRLVEAVQKFGPKRVRLYVIDASRRSELLGKHWSGEGNPDAIKQFNDGDVALSESEFPSTWRCLRERRVRAFVYSPNASGGTDVTRRGLAVEVVRELAPGIFKEDGEVWIDFPLQTLSEDLGKLTLYWDKDWPAEQFEVLKLLLEHSTALLEAFQKRGRMILQEKEYIRVDAVQESMGAIGHNLVTRMNPLDAVYQYLALEDYEDLETAQQVARFGEILRSVWGTVERTNKMLAAVTVMRAGVDIVALIRSELETGLPGRWKLTAPDRILVKADARLFRDAFAEMVRNSREIVGANHVFVDVNIDGGGRFPIRIVYEDNGRGVPRENKTRIFDAFFSSRPEGQTGDGLGLAFARKVIRAHGGDIVEDGEPGSGVRFQIELPGEEDGK